MRYRCDGHRDRDHTHRQHDVHHGHGRRIRYLHDVLHDHDHILDQLKGDSYIHPINYTTRFF